MLKSGYPNYPKSGYIRTIWLTKNRCPKSGYPNTLFLEYFHHFSLHFWQLFYCKKSTKIEKKIILRRSIWKKKKFMKKCSNNSVFCTIRVSEFGASIFGRSNGPNISGFRIIRISGLQHWWNPMCCSAAVCVDAYGIFIAYIIYYGYIFVHPAFLA